MNNNAPQPPRRRPRIGGIRILPRELFREYCRDREMRPLIDAYMDLEDDSSDTDDEAHRLEEQIERLIAERIWAEMPRLRRYDRIDREQVEELAHLRTAKLTYILCPP